MATVALTLVYAVLQISFVRPFLWPAGTGAAIAGDPASGHKAQAARRRVWGGRCKAWG